MGYIISQYVKALLHRDSGWMTTKELRFHYDCSWLTWTQGFTFWGRTIYFSLSEDQVTLGLLAHEVEHVTQRRRLCIFGWWWTGSIAWLVAYGAMWLWSFVSSVFRYAHAICGSYHDDVLVGSFLRHVYVNVWYERQAYKAMAACNEETK